MTTSYTAWTHDPTEPFSPAIYRKGMWHFQAHPAIVIIFLTLWLGVAAIGLPAMFAPVAALAQFTGVVLGFGMTVYILFYHLARHHERKNHMPHMTPYTIGILEHLSVVAFFALIAQVVFFR